MRRTVYSATLAALITASIMPSAGAGIPPYRPDSFVKVGPLSVDPADYKGFQVYNETAQGQTVRKRLRAGKVARFTFVARNQGTTTEDLFVQSCESDGPVKIKFVMVTDVNTNVSSQISGGMVLQDIAEDVGVGFIMTAKVPKNFDGRGTFQCSFEVTSTTSPSLVDISRARMPVKGR
jgi:hypothetical protein